MKSFSCPKTWQCALSLICEYHVSLGIRDRIIYTTDFNLPVVYNKNTPSPTGLESVPKAVGQYSLEHVNTG